MILLVIKHGQLDVQPWRHGDFPTRSHIKDTEAKGTADRHRPSDHDLGRSMDLSADPNACGYEMVLVHVFFYN